MGSLDEKVAVVTGANSGIGRAVAERLGRDGASVVVNFLEDEGAAHETVATVVGAGGDALAVEADVSDRSMVEGMYARAVDRWGRVDIVVNNAGVCPFMDLLDIDDETWDRVHAVNLKGTFLCSQVGARLMVEQGRGGRIIAISSVNARVGAPQQAAYGSSKAGQVSLMQSLAVSLGPHGITCNSVSPGSVHTGLNAHLLADPAVVRANEAWIPLGRVGAPADVAGIVAFLSGEEAAYISGADVLVDGGSFARRE